jgi:hypothetical protein
LEKAESRNHAAEFEGIGRGMPAVPGTRRIKVALPGYQIFETDINPLANRKVEIKTDLVNEWRSLWRSR